MPPAAFERLSSTAFADQREGFAFWEDGSFSDGPLSLRQAAARASLANPGCVEIEQCISVGGRRRARVTHTIALRKAAEVAAEQCVPPPIEMMMRFGAMKRLHMRAFGWNTWAVLIPAPFPMQVGPVGGGACGDGG